MLRLAGAQPGRRKSKRAAIPPLAVHNRPLTQRDRCANRRPDRAACFNAPSVVLSRCSEAEGGGPQGFPTAKRRLEVLSHGERFSTRRLSCGAERRPCAEDSGAVHRGPYGTRWDPESRIEILGFSIHLLSRSVSGCRKMRRISCHTGLRRPAGRSRNRRQNRPRAQGPQTYEDERNSTVAVVL